MYKLIVGLGYSIINEFLNPFSNYPGLLLKIEQHTIALSDSIKQYYRDNIPEFFHDALDTYWDSLMYYDSSIEYFQDDPNFDARQNLIEHIMGVPMRILISKEEEFQGCKMKNVKLITPDSIKNKEINNFYRYTFPISNHIAFPGESCDLYSSWFGHLFENESRISILDPYFFANNGRSSFEKYYLPKISKESLIEIYCNIFSSEISEEDIINLLRHDYADWKMRVHLCEKFHDRFIILSSIQISMSYGVCFMDASGVIKKSTINISNDSEVPLPRVEKTLYQNDI